MLLGIAGVLELLVADLDAGLDEDRLVQVLAAAGAGEVDVPAHLLHQLQEVLGTPPTGGQLRGQDQLRFQAQLVHHLLDGLLVELGQEDGGLLIDPLQPGHGLVKERSPAVAVGQGQHVGLAPADAVLDLHLRGELAEAPLGQHRHGEPGSALGHLHLHPVLVAVLAVRHRVQQDEHVRAGHLVEEAEPGQKIRLVDGDNSCGFHLDSFPSRNWVLRSTGCR